MCLAAAHLPHHPCVALQPYLRRRLPHHVPGGGASPSPVPALTASPSLLGLGTAQPRLTSEFLFKGAVPGLTHIEPNKLRLCLELLQSAVMVTTRDDEGERRCLQPAVEQAGVDISHGPVVLVVRRRWSPPVAQAEAPNDALFLYAPSDQDANLMHVQHFTLCFLGDKTWGKHN